MLDLIPICDLPVTPIFRTRSSDLLTPIFFDLLIWNGAGSGDSMATATGALREALPVMLSTSWFSSFDSRFASGDGSIPAVCQKILHAILLA